MDRRQFLTAAGSTGLAMSAGCMGYTIKESDEIQSLKQQIEKKENKIQTLQQDISTLESSNSELQKELNKKEKNLKKAKAKQVLYMYGYGITHYNNASDKYDSALSYYESENYNAARAEFNVAAGYADSAANSFSGAADRASELNYFEVEDWAKEAQNKASYMASAISDYQVAMHYLNNGNRSEANDYIDKGDKHYQQAQNYTMRDRSALGEQMGASINPS